jgi:quinol monooxygenase YgiN
MAFRAIAILKAKAGREQQLVDVTLEAMSRVRTMEGLERVEVSRSSSEPGRLIVYYWWKSEPHSFRYLEGPLYRETSPRLAAVIADQVLIGADLIDS